MNDSQFDGSPQSEASIESMVRDHYLKQSMPQDRVDAIVGAQSLAVELQRWRRIAVGSCIGLAAMTVFALTLLMQGDRPGEIPVASDLERSASETNGATTVGSSEPDAGNIPAKEAVASTDAKYFLVAFRSHGDACPFCRKTGETLRELKQSLQHDLVQIEQFHAGDPTQSFQAPDSLVANELDSLADGRTETAFVALTTDEGKLVEKFKPSLGGPAIAARVTEIIAQQDN